MIPPERFDIPPPCVGCSEGLDAFNFFFKHTYIHNNTEDRDEELNTIWESMVLREYRTGDCHEEVVRPLSHFDRLVLFPLFFWSTRDHSSLFKSMYEEHHLCVVALTSSERGTQFSALASYFLV